MIPLSARFLWVVLNGLEGLERDAALQLRKRRKLFLGCRVECRHFRNVWRNHLAHARESYDEPVALSVMKHVESFM